MEFVIGGLSSCVAEFLTLPIDTVKVKFQLDRSLTMTKLFWTEAKSFFSLFKTLCKGLEAAMLRQISYGSIRYGLYPFFKVTLTLFGDNKYGLLGNKLLAGSLSGAIAAALCSPTDLIRIRMQGSKPGVAKNDSFESIESAQQQEDEKEYEYKNVCDAFSTIIR